MELTQNWIELRLLSAAGKVLIGNSYWPALAAEAERYAEERIAADRSERLARPWDDDASIGLLLHDAYSAHPEDSQAAWEAVARRARELLAPAKPALPEEVAEGCVRVTMPIFVNGNGEIVAYFFDRNGKTSCLFGGEDGWHLVNVTADIPLPKPVTVRGEATP